MIRALLGIGKALGREVILPRMLCYCDFMWKESRAAAASGLPFTAIHRHPHDSQEMRNCRVGGGNRHKAIPALTRAPTREADSSDEEQERLLELGNDGR